MNNETTHRHCWYCDLIELESVAGFRWIYVALGYGRHKVSACKDLDECNARMKATQKYPVLRGKAAR